MAARDERVSSRAELELFLHDLALEIQADPEAIPNNTVASYVEGASGWVGDMHGWFKNEGREMPSSPTWAMIAMIFRSATVYE